MKKSQSNPPKKYLLVIYENNSFSGRVVKRIQTKSKNKFTRRLKLISNEFYVLLKVSYLDGGWNDGYYSTRKDLLFAYEAFTEK